MEKANKMADFALKMKLIIWKNLIIRRRRWIFTTFEIILPVLLYVIIASLNTLIPEFNRTFINETEYHSIDAEIDSFENLYFAPNNTKTLEIMMKVKERERRKCDHCDFIGFATEEGMINYLSEKNQYQYDVISVVFNNVPDDELPKKLNYRIRTPSTYYDLDRLYSRSSPNFAYDFYFYKSSNFLSLQKAIDSAFIELNRPGFEFDITTQQIPDPPHWSSASMNTVFSSVMPMCSVFAFMMVFVGIIQRVMEEKASGIKELMKMMGLKPWMIWSGWYLHSILATIISVTAITILMKLKLAEGSAPLVKYGDGLILWIFLFLYCTAGICFSFMISTIFKKPMVGTSVGSIIWIFTLVPVILIENKENVKSLSFIRNLILIFPNSCLSYGFKTMYIFEDEDVGMLWSNLYSLPNENRSYHSMGLILLILIIDSLIFLLFTWYIDNINPGDYGIGKSWNFPFERSYWCPRVEQAPNQGQDTVDSRDEVEAVSPDLHTGIKIRNLSKKFDGKSAVNGLNLDVYHNQITVLLGHNGAGKTTTMNIITGMISPTGGSVFVDGFSIGTSIDKVRESLGLCPQHNVQFPDLTVLEHLMFFAMLKGMQKNKAKEESLQYLSRLSMSSKANKKARTLSGGMRRRLSLGMALVGNTKVLMLDEPTSGMDPEARREIWDLLLSMRGARTILITTHYMEEADILGDRIAIMHSGQLECYGTPLFLKKHYGTGYVLSILLSREIDINELTNAITTYVPSATVKNITVGSVKFELPTSDTSALSELFSNLEENKDELGVASFGVSITTMDDVFLKVGKIADEHNKENTYSDADSATLLLTTGHTTDIPKSYNTGFNLIAQQFWALLVKRALYCRYKLIMFLIAILIPLVFEIFTIFSTSQANSSGTNESRVLELKMYQNTKTYFSYSGRNEEIASYYSKFIKAQHSQVLITDNVSQAIIDLAEEYPKQYHSMIVAAAELNFIEGKRVLNAMYGKYPTHSPAVSLNALTNAVLKYAFGDEYSITVGNNPLPDTGSYSFEADGTAWMTLYTMGLAVCIAILLGFHTSERVSGVKHLQIMSGVSRYMYWLNNYFFDMLIYLFITILSVIIVAAMDESLSAAPALRAFTLIVFLFGLSVFPFSYLYHYRPTVGSVVTFTIWTKIIFGIILPIVIMIWEYVPDQKKELRVALTYIYLLCPHFAIAYGLNKIVVHAAQIYKWENMNEAKKITECLSDSFDCCDPESQACKDMYNFYAGENSICCIVGFLILDIFLYFAIFFFIDYGYLRKSYDYCVSIIIKTFKYETEEQLDSDVVEEKRRVIAQISGAQKMSSDPSDDDVLLVSNLQKWFGKFHAVKGLNFGVKESECFGLLGINGAGKTTTFKMLTGELFVSTGAAKLLQYSLQHNKKDFLKQIGYCPQFDAFNFELTTRQMLTLFANLRGISKDQIKAEVDKWLHKFDIMKYQNIKCANLSGGNKRKLSTAIALIGDPPLVMLDEPTSGVDPVARRNLWSILATMRQSGQAIVLTSHSMDECEALCNRLAIMVDGQLKCIGDIQYLKNKFGQGFTVMIKLRNVTTVQSNDNVSFEAKLNDLKTVIQEKYVCTLKDEHKGMIMYHITDTNAKLSEIFEFMESLKQSRDIIEDFTVGDTSLEQVFLSFAKEKLAAKDKSVKTSDVV